jgi:hypothetical protein
LKYLLKLGVLRYFFLLLLFSLHREAEVVVGFLYELLLVQKFFLKVDQLPLESLIRENRRSTLFDKVHRLEHRNLLLRHQVRYHNSSRSRNSSIAMYENYTFVADAILYETDARVKMLLKVFPRHI